MSESHPPRYPVYCSTDGRFGWIGDAFYIDENDWLHWRWPPHVEKNVASVRAWLRHQHWSREQFQQSVLYQYHVRIYPWLSHV